MELTEQEIDALKKAHGINRIYRLESDNVAIYVRMPSPGVWRRFRSHVNDPRKRDEAGEAMLRASLIKPSQEEFSALLEERPGLLDTFANEVTELAGLKNDVEKKVL